MLETLQSPESKLKEMLGLTKISHNIVVDKLDTLASKRFFTGIRCQIGGRSDQRMADLRTRGFLTKDTKRSSATHNVYKIIVKGYDLMDLAQEYLNGEN